MGLRYVITGCKYSGTKYAARLLTSVGLPCCHETFSRHHGLTHPQERNQRRNDPPWRECVAESSCWAAQCLDHPWFANTQIVHLVRHPILVLRSVWTEFLAGHRRIARALKESMRWWVDWNAQVEIFQPVRVRLEDCPEALLVAIGKLGSPHWIPTQEELEQMSKWRVRKGQGPFDLDSFEQLPASLEKTDLIAMAARYGYS